METKPQSQVQEPPSVQSVPPAFVNRRNPWNYLTIGLILIIIVFVGYLSWYKMPFRSDLVPITIPTASPNVVATMIPTSTLSPQAISNEELFALVSLHKAELLKNTGATNLKFNSVRTIGTDLYMVEFVYINQDGSVVTGEGSHALVGKVAENWTVAIGLPTDPYYCTWVSQSNLSDADKNYFRSNSACP